MELLTAVTILAIILALLGQMLTLASTSYTEANRRIDNFTLARLTLDLMAEDLENAVYRPDLAFCPSGGTTSSFAFYTRRTGSSLSADRLLSLVSYQIDPARFVLQRGDYSVLWSDSSVSLGNNTSLPEMGAGNANLNWQDVSPGVIQMAVTYLSPISNSGQSYLTTYNGVANANPPPPLLYITLVVLDSKSRSMLTTSQVTALQGKFSIPANTTTDCLTLWENVINTQGFLSGYPAQVRSGLAVFQRAVYLPQPATISTL